MSSPTGGSGIKCSLCPLEAEDSLEWECGNNAENSIELNLCQKHLDLSEDYKAFTDQFGREIEQMNSERQCPI